MIDTSMVDMPSIVAMRCGAVQGLPRRERNGIHAAGQVGDGRLLPPSISIPRRKDLQHNRFWCLLRGERPDWNPLTKNGGDLGLEQFEAATLLRDLHTVVIGT